MIKLRNALAVVLIRSNRLGVEYVIVNNSLSVRGMSLDAVIWLREPTEKERTDIIPALSHNNGIEIRGFPNEVRNRSA